MGLGSGGFDADDLVVVGGHDTFTGPDHEKIFEIEVFINNQLVAKGMGKSKKEAEQSAAFMALEALRKKSKVKDEESIIRLEKGDGIVWGGKRPRHRG